MKASLKTIVGRALFIALGLLAGLARAEPDAPLRWEKLSNMPTGVFDAAISVRGHEAVITGGITQTGQTSGQVQVFDLEKLTWSTPLRFAHGLCQHAQVTLSDGRIFVFGGLHGQLPGKLEPSDVGYVIDLDAKRVSKVPPIGEPLHVPTCHLLPDGRVAVIGGKAAYLFDPEAHHWKGVIPLHEARRSHASLLMEDGRILVVGGQRCDAIEIIDVAAGKSQLLTTKLPMPLDDLRLAALSPQRVILLGGQSARNGDTTDRSWVLDLSGLESRLEDGPSLGIPGGVADHCVTRVGPWIIILGGETQQSNKDTELAVGRMIYPQMGWVWSIPKMSQPHDDSVSVTVGRQVIIFGGYRVKAMTLPCLNVGENENTRSMDFPSIGLPVAAGIVERLTLPEGIEPKVTVNDRPPDSGTHASATVESFAPTSAPGVD